MRMSNGFTRFSLSENKTIFFEFVPAVKVMFDLSEGVGSAKTYC